MTPNVVWRSFDQHVRYAALRSAPRAVMSFDALGDPAAFVTTIGTAAADVVRVPYRAPEFGPALVSSAANMAGMTVYAVADSLSKISGHLATGMAFMSPDDIWKDGRLHRQIEEPPRHALDGIRIGAAHLGAGVASGIKGIAVSVWTTDTPSS